MKKKLIVFLAFSIGLILEAVNTFAQPNFRPPTTSRDYTGYYGEKRPGRTHWNLDIGGTVGNLGDPVVASADGTIKKTGYDDKYGGGRYIIIEHGDGYRTTYCHLHDIIVEENQSVTTGEFIGSVGWTGNAKKPHLDFGIRHYSQPLNPLDLLWPEKYTCKSNTGCPGKEGAGRPPWDTRPGWRPPDDTFSVADATFSTIPNLEDAYYLLAVKKDKTIVINYYWCKTLIKERDTYFENLPEGSTPDQAYLDNLEAKISQLYESFGPNQEYFWKEYLETPDVAVLQRGFPDGVKSLLGRFMEPITEVAIDFSPQEVIKHHPVLIIPSGGLYGMQGSAMFKAALDEYVKSGGTLIVFTQPKGIHFLPVPAPDGEPIGVYGWDEDINCFFKGAYLNQYHPIVSSLTKSMPNINIDGHMISIPDGAVHILTRSSNGQPILALYEHGLGKVIVSTMYTDFAYGSSQAGPDEIAIVRDMVAWAKSPVQLTEIRPGETVSVPVTVENNTIINAVSVKLSIYDPDRKNLLKEEVINFSVPAGSYSQLTTQYPTLVTSSLGIYHIDYTLLDASGNIIQPRSETDESRFIVSSPPQTGYEGQGLTFDILTDAEVYISGAMATFTIRISNRSSTEKTVKVRILNSGQEQTITVAPGGIGLIPYTAPVSYLSVSFYDQTGASLGSSYKMPVIYSPSANIKATTDKTLYAKGETLTINTSVKNNIPVNWQPFVKITVRDFYYGSVFEDTKTVSLTPYGVSSVLDNLTLPMTAGTYYVMVQAWYGNWPTSWYAYSAFSRFEVVQSQISAQPNLPSAFVSGLNNIPFIITNRGRIDVSSGKIDVSLKDPEGINVFSGSQPFTLAVGENKTLDLPISIPSLKLGNYILTYSQSDETRTGTPTNITILNSIQIGNLRVDKATYKIRETANLSVNLANIGKFILENISVAVSVPDFNYTDAKTIPLGINPNATSINFSIPIPETVTAGQHNVNVTASVSPEASLAKTTTITVPQSALVVGYQGPASVSAGDTINLSIENTGGVDTTYTTQDLSINDGRNIEIYRGNAAGGILAGEKKALVDIQIPSQTSNGPAYLHVQMKDEKTEKTISLKKVIQVNGITALLQTRTDKEAYLNTESITGITNLLNGQFGIVDGSLKISVTKMGRSATGQFTQFLPKQAGVSFSYPGGVAVGPDGSVYVADTDNRRIQKLDSNGSLITRWGTEGSQDGQFYEPWAVAVGPDGSVYVADSGNDRVQKFDSNGNFITKWGSYCATDTNGDGIPDQSCADGQFYYPEAIAVGPDGSVYVPDDNHRIQKFDSNGNFIIKWGSYCATDTNGDGIPDQSCGDGQFYYPVAIAAGADGSVYVVDINHHIQKFDSNGNFIAKWGSYCSTDSNWDGVPDQPCDGQFYYPYGIATGPDGSVYVTDSGNSRIQKFDSNGNFITKWGSYCYADSDGDGVPDQPCDGQFEWPGGIAIGSDDSVYVADSGNNRIEKFDSNGNFVSKWGDETASGGGSEDGEFYLPVGVAVGSDGSIYISDSGNDRIQKFDSSGTFLTKWGNSGSEDGQFSAPIGIGVGPDGSVYVADTGNHRVQKFDGSGNLITKWGGYCNTDEDGDGVDEQPCAGQFYYPMGIGTGPDGSVYVADSGNNRIQKFDSNGNFITMWRYFMPEQGLNRPLDVAVGPDGMVYVADTYNHRIEKFDGNGSFIKYWEIYAFGCGEGSCPPISVTVGSDGFIYVTARINQPQLAATSLNETEPADYPIQKFDTNGNFVAGWGSYGSGDGQFRYPEGIAIAPDGSVYVADVGNHRIQRMMTEGVTEILFETTLTINQSAGIAQDYITNIGTLNAKGKLYLQADLKNSLGQAIAQASYPFYIFEGDTILLFNTDKKVYKPGETVTITGQVGNRATIEAAGLTLTLHSKLNTQNSELLFTESFNIPAGGAHPFTITTTAGTEGTLTLTGIVTQNNSTLAEIADQYEVAKPNVSVAVSVPDVVGNEPFSIDVEIKNTGKVGATIQFGVQSSEFGDSQTIAIPAGETKQLQYSQQISKNVTYTLTFAGDYQTTVTKMVLYGIGASIQFGAGGSELGVFPEGIVAVPVIITNTGQLIETMEVTFELNPGSVKQTKVYSLPTGESTTDYLYFNLTEGDYQISATSQGPDASAQASLSVRKENQVQMGVSLGTQTDGLVPVMVNLNNVGFNEINGSVSLSVTTGSGQVVWSGEEALSQLSPQSAKLINFNINPSAIEPGTYTLQAQILNNSNQVIATQSLEFGVQSANFQITQLPPYQTFAAGQEATFTFIVKNIGNQEGSFDLRFKAYDLIDSTQREWLKAGEEKAVPFNFMLPEDLEEKDYFADYELKASVVAGQSKGQIKYHLAGISLNVNATLDKPYYTEGETAHLTINIQTSSSNPQNLFARVNYAGYEPQQTFTLSGSQVLIFDVPLPKITGEKLFYGIYHEGGRSIHLNSLYIHKAGDVITVTTDKQVYNAGETVSMSVSGNASGDMTLTGPGGYSETFAFTGSITKTFSLPSSIAAGTYFINLQLITQNSELITAVYPFDVAGIQVKVLECNNDKGKYASSDTIATSFTISSNTTMPAILKAWIVDPTGQYASVGELSITLSSSESSLITYNSPLTTSVSGIHRLVYGIYGPEDLLLCSGSEAFDVGDAVLMGLSTDKRDYPTNTEPVIVTASLFGSVNAELQLELDGAVIKNETILLNGFTPYTTQIQDIIPGPHTLKATLTAGGLKSTKETSFTYALAYMPKPQISASPGSLDFGSLNLGSASTQSITLSSTGNVDLVVGTIVLSGTNQGEFSLQNDNCSGRTITPSGTCTLDIVFSPTSLGSKSASLSVPSNAIDTPTLILSLGGAGATTLNLSINPESSGRVTGTGIDCPGDCTENFSTSGAAIQLTATPAEGYVFTNWTGDINVTENPVTMNMDTSKNVTANFGINAYTINVTVSLGGNITPSGSVTVNPGGSQTFIVTPNPGYYIVDVRVDGVSVGAVTTYTFNNLNANHTIEVSFAINQYTITATAGSNGTILPLGTLIVNYGGSQIFTITPDAGYHVADVKVDGISIGAVTTFTFDNVTSNHAIEVTFEVDNNPPVANAGPDQNVMTGQVVTLNGSESFDPEGGTITFLWTFVEVPAGSSVTNASLSDLTSAKPEFTPDVNGAYRLKLIVNDGALDSVLDEALIHAATPNVAPNANAGPDQNVYTGNTVQLDGSMSSDPDNGPLPLSYLWSFTAKPAGSLLTDNAIVNRNMPNASFIPDVDGLYELRLTINDGHLSSEDMVQIIATLPNVPPNANAGADMTIYMGNTAVLNGSASNDPDQGPQPLAFLWSFVAVPTGSQLANGAISGTNTASPSFTPDVAGTYVLQLMVYDGIDAGFDNVAVTVIQNQPPNAAPTGGGVYEVNTPVILRGQVSDVDGDLITYEWLEGNQILSNGQIGTIYGGSPVNLPEQTISLSLGTHIITLRVSDGINLPVTSDITIEVIDTSAPALAPVPDKTILWPPNHQMVDITIWANASDNTGNPVALSAVVSSNEPQDGLGDGDTSPDWTEPVIDQLNGIITLQLRSERSGAGNGRIYTIAITGTDASGNSSQANVEIKVPHDKGKK